MNFSTIKQIVIPEGIVKKIEDGEGNIIWQKPASKVLVSIAVAGYNSVFTKGSAFSFGGTVTATYSDSTTADVTSSTTFSGYNMSSNGYQTVTASYTEGGVTETTTYQILVREQATATVTWNRTQVINAVYTVPSQVSIKFVTESTFKNSCASKLGINVNQIISTGTYKWHNYWRDGVQYANSKAQLYWKKSNSTSGANWWNATYNRTASSSEQQDFTITTTPAWNTQLYSAFRYYAGGSWGSIYMCTTSSVCHPQVHSTNTYPWSFSCVVTYWKYTN